MEVYIRQGTATLQVKHWSAGDLTDADSAKIYIKDQSGQFVVENQDMSKTATGTYQYYYTSDSSATYGIYKANTILTKGTHVARDKITFEIVEEYT